LTALNDDAELLVSELVTNAVAASPSVDRIVPVRLWLRADQTRVLVLIRDISSEPPVPMKPGPDAETGRGMLLVEAVSQRWDWYLTEGSTGKIVWALAVREVLPRQATSSARSSARLEWVRAPTAR
jgi:anti-sigma regulatory factor (Ser/Thr protein kinase)